MTMRAMREGEQREREEEREEERRAMRRRHWRGCDDGINEPRDRGRRRRTRTGKTRAMRR